MEWLEAAHGYLAENGLDGWLLADFRGHNPLLAQVLGRCPPTTRRTFLFVPPLGPPRLLAHQVDAGNFVDVPFDVQPYTSRADLLEVLSALLDGAARVAMEYSPQGLLPMVSYVDAGTVEMVRELGVEVVSSADLLQFALARWDEGDLQAHLRAARKLGRIAQEAFAYIGHHQPTEFEAAQFILRRFRQEGLSTDSGPVVAANRNSSNPHHEPQPSDVRSIGPGDWVLLDLWAKEEDGPYADITWVGFFGARPPAPQQECFDLVVRARDLAVELLQQAWAAGVRLEGWQVDEAARDYLSASHLGRYFTHRLGHSLGRMTHGFGANLDSYETLDTRPLIQGLAFSVEPGLYLPEFGVRSEVDVYIGEDGPTVTTGIQTEIARIIGR
ncbi:MAG: Xaa-Pro peptidase family protein [Chloroflexi bacterium]|nr:Xaa-Pro peptidase family protein [Chloroflexota bacterium]MCL5025102.1 Xaa-Pro peptidase family protein [Chloroflexota bacterium]